MSSSSRLVRRALLVLLLAFAAFTYGWGIRRDLPWALGSDEINFALLATRIAATGNPNPRWFGHPGATFLYPYAAGLHSLDAARGAGDWLTAKETLPLRMEKDPVPYLLVGRWLSVLYGLGALVLVHAIGDRVFGPPVGIIGAWLALLSPLTLEHVQMIRTDGAGLFFGLLALWLCLRALEVSTVRRQLLAGLAIGAAIGTRYFLVALAPILVLVDFLVWKRASERPSLTPFVAGLVAIPLGFALVSPYALLEFGTVLADLEHESRASHPGADGLSPLGNLWWYVTSALPDDLSIAELALMAIGIVLAIARRTAGAIVLLAFVAIFLAGTSLSALHWARWLIQILPLLALFAAFALVEVARWTAQRVGGSARVATAVLVVCVIAISALPASGYVRFALRLGTPSTRDVAREWIVQNVPAGSRIAGEHYTAALQNTPFAADYQFSLTDLAGSPDELRRAGYRFAMVSQGVYGRYFAQPQRYPREVAFYQRLFRTAKLLEEFRAGPDGRGPVIRIYRLP